MDPITLQELIDAATSAADGQTPQDAVAALLAEKGAGTDVDALLNEAREKFNGLYEGGVTSDEEAAAVEALAEVAEGVSVEVGRRQEASQARADRLAELARRVNPESKDGNDPAADPDADPADGDPAPEGDPAAAPADPAPAPAADPAPADAGAPAPEAVAASASRPRRRQVRLSDLPAPEQVRRPEPDQTRVAITAAADVDGYSAGARMDDLAAVAKAATQKFQAFPRDIVEGRHIVSPVAQFRVPFPEELTVRSDRDADRVLNYATDQSRLPQPLTAAGTGWCSPSDRIWELSPLLADANAGLVDVAEVQSPHGGLMWIEGPDYTAIYTGTNMGFIQTEAQNVAGSGFTTPVGGTVTGTSKPIFQLPCLDSWNEKRAEAIGFGIGGDTMQHDAWPEITEDVIAHALIAHAHRINARTINRMVADAGSPVTLSLGPSATPQLLNSIEIQIEDIRYANRIGDDVTLKVTLPRWVKPLIRADQSIRTGSSPSESFEVENAKIEDWFRKRNAIPEFVYDWQDAFTSGSGFGGASPITSWPTTVDVLVHLPSTYARSRGDIITMQAVYDTTNLVQNKVLHLFVEEKLLVIKRRYKPRLLRIALSANGTTAAPQILDSNGKIVPPA